MDHDAEDDHAAHYNDTNRAFLQSFLARGTLTLPEGKKVLAAIFTVQAGNATTADEVTQEDFDSYISAAADALSPFDYEIRSTQHQTSKERVYALVNSNSDALTQLATTRTTEEIFYIKRLLDGMFETFNTKRVEVMAITSMQAGESRFRRGSGGRQSSGNDGQAVDKGVSQEQVEKLLAGLLKENWLERSKAGFYRLAPRALIELRSWLLDTYNDSDDPDEWQRIKFCEACREIVTVGQRCSDVECNVRLHDICDAAFWNSRPAKTCPRCERPWDGKGFVGEKAVTSRDDRLKGKERSQAGSSSKGSRVGTRVEDRDEQGGRAGPQRNGRAAEPVPSEEEEEEEDEDEE